MTAVIFHILAWPTLGGAVFVFGFAPGALLRLIVLVFKKSDPRRQELLAELHAVPRIERPFWVAEQLEVALFEGLPGRFMAAIGMSGRLTLTVIDQHSGTIEMPRRLWQSWPTEPLIGIPGQLTVRRSLTGKQMHLTIRLTGRSEVSGELCITGRTMLAGIDILHGKTPSATF
jgi:hypothetical protein